MKNKQIDRLLSDAIELVGTYMEENDAVPKEYESAAVSFGGAIIQSGRCPLAPCT